MYSILINMNTHKNTNDKKMKTHKIINEHSQMNFINFLVTCFSDIPHLPINSCTGKQDFTRSSKLMKPIELLKG